MIDIFWNLVHKLLFILLLIYLIVEIYLSLDWRMMHDTPLLTYTAYLIEEHGLIPYKDIFETSMPGSILFHIFIGKVFGWEDQGFRYCDILLFFFLSYLLYQILINISKKVAIYGTLFWGIHYFSLGQYMHLQRDYIGVIPIILACHIAINKIGSPSFRLLSLGLLTGLSFWIKPHLILGAFPIFFFIISSLQHQNVILVISRYLTLSCIGFFIPSVFIIIFMWSKGSIEAWWDIFIYYLPLHTSLNGEHTIITSYITKYNYAINRLSEIGGLQLWLLPFGITLSIIFFNTKKTNTRQIKTLKLLTFICLCYFIYPLISGQFWSYHWMPFSIFFIITATGFLINKTSVSFHTKRFLATQTIIYIYIILFILKPSRDAIMQLKGIPPRQPAAGLVDEIAIMLNKEMNTNELIQPIDWTSGAIHALLISKKKIATRFLYDYHFYHHTNNQYIKNLKIEFLRVLNTKKPKYILIMCNREKVSGQNTQTEFPELDFFINKNYKPKIKNKEYILFERKKSS